jgi:hypothetical protein
VRTFVGIELKENEYDRGRCSWNHRLFGCFSTGYAVFGHSRFTVRRRRSAVTCWYISRPVLTDNHYGLSWMDSLDWPRRTCKWKNAW